VLVNRVRLMRSRSEPLVDHSFSPLTRASRAGRGVEPAGKPGDQMAGELRGLSEAQGVERQIELRLFVDHTRRLARATWCASVCDEVVGEISDSGMAFAAYPVARHCGRLGRVRRSTAGPLDRRHGRGRTLAVHPRDLPSPM
jgi:hypothetical protein